MVESLITEIGIPQLKELATDSFRRIYDNRLTNGLIPATVGRCDNDPSFDNCNVWVKDHVRAANPHLVLYVPQALPEIAEPLKELSFSSLQAILQVQGQPAQLRRFQSRPGRPDENGYSTIDDREAPAIKFTRYGDIYEDWGHHQPDNWGTFLHSAGKAIEIGLPILKDEAQPMPLGAILQEIISYVVNLRTERSDCRSIWEHNKAWSSYSTRRIVHAGLEQIAKVWLELEADSQIKGYQLKTSPEQLKNAISSLGGKVKEHFPADYTDIFGHDSAPDLAQGVVANDLNDSELPADEREEIMKNILELENRLGCYRYTGDNYQLGRAEAIWTMGKPIIARYFFLKAIKLYEQRKPREAFRALNHGLDRIADILAIKKAYGYIPELFKDVNKQGYAPNNNELAWTLAYIIEAAAAGIAALNTAEQYDQIAA